MIGWMQVILAYKIINEQQWQVLDKGTFQGGKDFVTDYLSRKFSISSPNISSAYHLLKDKKHLSFKRFYILNRMTNYISKKVIDNINIGKGQADVQFKDKSIIINTGKNSYQVIYNGKYQQQQGKINYQLEIDDLSGKFKHQQSGTITCR